MVYRDIFSTEHRHEVKSLAEALSIINSQRF